MSGHSKWNNIKGRKSKQDAIRGRFFTRVSKEIILAVKEGGPDPEANLALKNAINRAKAVNMPNDNIRKVIEKYSGGEGENFEEIYYEGYGPGGVAVLVKAATDNRNRTSASLRHLFSKYGGNMGETGCVSWMFENKGVITLPESSISEDELLETVLDAGGEDLNASDGIYEIYTDPLSLHLVKEVLDDKGIKTDTANIIMVPKNTVELNDEARATKVLKLMEALEEDDDVQDVFSNFDIPSEMMEKIA